MKNEYFFKRHYSADHQETLSFIHTSDNEYCLDFCESIGGQLVIGNPRLADLMGVEPISRAEAKKALLDASDAGNHVFGINAGDHSGYWFHFVDGLPTPDYWDGFGGLNFLIIDRERFLMAFPRESYCRKNVHRKLTNLEDYFQSSINGWLVQVSYQGSEDSFIFGTFASEEEAVSEAAKEFPHIKYCEDDFEVIGYRLKSAAA